MSAQVKPMLGDTGFTDPSPSVGPDQFIALAQAGRRERSSSSEQIGRRIALLLLDAADQGISFGQPLKEFIDLVTSKPEAARRVIG
jgi:hypothetical protein